MTDSPNREQIARELAEELGYEISFNGLWSKSEDGELDEEVHDDIRDALISREVKIRELEAALAEVANTIGGPVTNYASAGVQLKEYDEKIDKAVSTIRLALHTKEEKGK